MLGERVLLGGVDHAHSDLSVLAQVSNAQMAVVRTRPTARPRAPRGVRGSCHIALVGGVSAGEVRRPLRLSRSPFMDHAANVQTPRTWPCACRHRPCAPTGHNATGNN